MKGTLFAMGEEKSEKSLWLWFKETHSSELMVVNGEDIVGFPVRVENGRVQVRDEFSS